MPREKPEKKEDIDFEIQFYESLLKKRPHFKEALMALGDLYTRKGLYQNGLEIDEKLAQLNPKDAIILYNLSCSYSLTNQIEKSLKALKKAVENGYDDFDYLSIDRDLDNLRKDSRFQEFFSRMKDQKPTKTS